MVSVVRWRVLGASVRGAAHIRDGSPNQDGLALVDPTDHAAPRIAAVADGHGGARHFRSAIGARAAVDVAVEVLRELAETIDHNDAVARDKRVEQWLPRAIVARWRAAVEAHMEQNAITADEWARVEAAEGPAALASVRAEPILAYGATLLAALATVRGIVLTQLGDGDILVVGWNDEVSRPLPRDQRLTGNRTTSLCLADAERDFRAVYIDDRHERVQLVVLTTDGYANSFRSDSDFLQIGIDFAAMVRARGAQTVAGELEPILREASEQGSGDDITLALISSLPHSPSTIRPGSDAAPPRRDARGLRRRLVLAAIATAIAAGVWVERERRGQVSGHGSSPP